METTELVRQLRSYADEIPHLKSIQQGYQNPHVKSWKTKLSELLGEGGSTCRKSLDLLSRMRRQMGSSDFVNQQTYINHLDAMQRSLKQCIQTIEVFGRPEERDRDLPKWGKPKSQQRAVGCLKVGDEEVCSSDISIHEVLDCLVSLSEDSNDLSENMRETLVGHLRAILDDDLLQPYLEQKMDVLLGHWPEFQSN